MEAGILTWLIVTLTEPWGVIKNLGSEILEQLNNSWSIAAQLLTQAWNMFLVKTYGFWHKKNSKLCPKIVELFRPFKDVSSISISFLSPGKHIPPHNGPYKGILRYQLAISVPKNGNCQLFVDNKPYSWTEGKGVMFDDTYVHEVRNETDETRIAVLLDLRRKNMPWFLKVYDFIFFKIIQLLVILNRTMKKSTVS